MPLVHLREGPGGSCCCCCFSSCAGDLLSGVLSPCRQKWPGVAGVWPPAGGGELGDGRAALCVSLQRGERAASHCSCGEGVLLAEEDWTPGWVGGSRGKCSLSV